MPEITLYLDTFHAESYFVNLCIHSEYRKKRTRNISVVGHGFDFLGHVSDDCHDLTMLSVNISKIATITVKNVDYRCYYS